MPNNSQVKLPIIIAVAIAVGLWIGATFFSKNNIATPFRADKDAEKWQEVLQRIGRDYTDSVATDTLTDYAITELLAKLDPHSRYVPEEEVALDRADLEAGFDGIGVEFHIFHDSVYITKPIPNGPSAKAGLRSGDCLLAADTTKLAGKKIDNRLIFSNLRGKKGTPVTLTVLRRGQPKPLKIVVKRDRIPMFSVDAGYFLDKQTGYIKIDRFAETTAEEFKKVLANLKERGATRWIIDLRDNGGGRKQQATLIADELLDGNRLLVRTNGKNNDYNEETLAEIDGIAERDPLIVMIDEGSASASEIVAGAIQDHDRGLLVGRRTFGKGLVQAPMALPDGSELILTISRYYTPSGRCIQKPYGTYNDDEDRYASGEAFTEGKMKIDKTQSFRTPKGRTVYGGGGIIPDAFVPADTSQNSPYLYALLGKSVIDAFAFQYAESHRKELVTQPFDQFNKHFVVDENALKNLIGLANASGIPYREKEFQRSKSYIIKRIKALIASQVWETRTNTSGLRNEFFRVFQQDDKSIQKAMSLFPEAKKMAETY